MSVSTLTYKQIGDDVLAATRPPRPLYYLLMLLLAAGVATFFSVWIYQVKTGMGVAGINHPVGWGVYIGNFVFWVGIAHSGTLISAILHLVRSKWRSAVSRAAEAMTVFAVMTAGLFPLIHLGRVWVFYYIIPYPSQRQIWPNFTSALLWDVVAVTTYLTVSTIFWYVGMIPDLAAARDRWTDEVGPRHPRTRLYRRLALGWTGSGRQWHHYGRAYLFFAALATPLVVSVHSVVSWDFATSILPGWHNTIFPPYFVAGAIHSGLAMVLTLMIPLRKLLRLERLVTVHHLESVAQMILVTAAIVGYAYLVEPFIAWYSGDIYEMQFAAWRATGGIAVITWALPVLNVLIPLALVVRRVRRSLVALFLISLAINLGMWLERAWIVIGSTAHDFLPHNWGPYMPTWVEWTITAGSFSFFLFWFFGFAKLLPTVAASEVKETVEEPHALHALPAGSAPQPACAATGVLGSFPDAGGLLKALGAVRQGGYDRVETFSPFRLEAEGEFQNRPPSPVRLWTLVGAMAGMVGGFALAIGSAYVNGLTVGGKHTPTAYIPYCIIAFEGTVLLGTLANLAGLIVHGRLGRRIAATYRPRFGRDKFGLFVACAADETPAVRALMEPAGAEEVHVLS